MADGKRALRIRPDWATVTTLVAALLVAAVVLFSTLNGSGGYGFEDLATVGTALVLLVLAFVPVVVRLFSGQNDWPARLLPLVIWIAALYIVIEPPPPYVNFVLLRGGRERAVQMIQQGALRPNDRGVVNVSSAGPMLSAGGDEAMVDSCGSQTCVLFFYYRGLLHHYSGYLFVPSGGDAESFDDLIQQRGFVQRVAANWYFVGQ
jgi:hypothetical protein